MTTKEAYIGNQFAEAILSLFIKAGINSAFSIRPVIDTETIEQIKSSSLIGLDSRSKPKAEPGIESVFKGLAFDNDNVRTQATAIYHDETPIALMTQVIAPNSYVAAQRYFERMNGAIAIRDFQVVGKQSIADFLVVPGWTILDPRYRLPKTLIRPAFDTFLQILDLIKDNAPLNTYIETVAQGKYPTSKRNDLLEIAKKPVGSVISEDLLPFRVDLIGQNDEGSKASVNMAKRIGLSRVENVGSSRSLGPVFIKKLN